MVTDTETDILQRILEAESESLTPEAARYVLTLQFRSRDHRRIEELAAKSNEGTLSAQERDELERYNRVRLLLVRLKSTARRILDGAGDVGPTV
jgi:hypothetical protein